jgi:hypothetical protein
MGNACSRRNREEAPLSGEDFEVIYSATEVTRRPSSSLNAAQRSWRKCRDKVKSALALRLIYSWSAAWQNLFQKEKGKTARWAIISSIRGKATARLGKLRSRLLCSHLVRKQGVLRFVIRDSERVDKEKERKFVDQLVLHCPHLNSRARETLNRQLQSL